MKNRVFKPLLPILSVLVALLACSDDEMTGPGAGAGPPPFGALVEDTLPTASTWQSS